MQFKIFSRRTIMGRRWYWRLRARNGEIIAQGEGYHNLQDARDTIDAIREEAMDANVHIEWPDGSSRDVGPKG